MGGHTVCISNVPGPQIPLAVAGKEVVAVEVIYPNVIPQVSLFSYRGKICGNIVVDSDIVPRPELLAHMFTEEVRRMGMAYGVQ
mmetsp:Transcript_39290/g.62927  ORF Transcript_39290/g.62927 Transcript_39290/m.62927 type:complete len:84 (-) Transcript_39290:78-329(-)